LLFFVNETIDQVLAYAIINLGYCSMDYGSFGQLILNLVLWIIIDLKFLSLTIRNKLLLIPVLVFSSFMSSFVSMLIMWLCFSSLVFFHLLWGGLYLNELYLLIFFLVNLA